MERQYADTLGMVSRDLGLPKPCTRRQLLRAAAAVLAGSAMPVSRGQTTQPAVTSQPAWVRGPRSRVVDARSASLLSSTFADPVRVRNMLERSLEALTATPAIGQAWRSVLGDAKKICLKFNSVGAAALNTSWPVASALVSSLRESGYEDAQLTLVELAAHQAADLGGLDAAPGWGETIRVGSHAEPLARYWLDADAVINVPFLKAHRIAGLSASMKNISHAIIRHPARYHADGCSPFVGDVVGCDAVRTRLKLNVVNALRIVVDGGPEADSASIFEYGGLLTGLDPVAVDTVALGLLAVERHRQGISGALRVPYLAHAGEIGLGHWRPSDIERVGLDETG